ncbi:MAG: PepSY domain-containing protein [Christensenellales bacterium]
MGEANAKAIALAHAGLDSGSITAYECKLDREDSRMAYEIDFRCGGFEYEYEIDAVSGAVVKQDKDMDGR